MTRRYDSAGHRTPGKPLPKMPTLKQMQSVTCPACNAELGMPCTLRGGHQARVEAYRAAAASSAPARQTPASQARPASAKPRSTARTCPICRKPLGKRPTGKAKSGKTCHAACLTHAKDAGTGARREWNTAAAEREFARNKARVEDGQTYRARQSTGWKLGGSPSTAGEIKR